MTIDIVIPNYNGSHLYEKNLPKVFASLGGYSGKVIIVDDGSRREDKDNLKRIVLKFQNEEHPIKFIDLPTNSGFSSAVNTGVKASSAEFVVLLNSDVMPTKDFLKSPINKLSSDANIFGIGCMDKSIENGKTILRGRGVGRWEKGFIQHSRGEVDKVDTFWISGGSSVIRRELFEEIGGFDEIYNPFYWEDIDLSYRAQKAGFKVYFDPDSVVVHEHDEGAIKKNYKKNSITLIAQRNQFIFIWKNITSSNFLLDHFIRLPMYIFGAFVRGDWIFLRGLFIAIKFLPVIINKRKAQKKLYKVLDSEIINHIS